MATISTPEPDLIVLNGEIDLSFSPTLKAAFREVVERSPRVAYVDMTGVTYIDSSGLAALIEALQGLKPRGGQLALFGLHENVQNIFHISRLDLVFPIFADVTAARAALA